MGGERASEGWEMNNSVGEEGEGSRARERREDEGERVFFKKDPSTENSHGPPLHSDPHIAQLRAKMSWFGYLEVMCRFLSHLRYLKQMSPTLG